MTLPGESALGSDRPKFDGVVDPGPRKTEQIIDERSVRRRILRRETQFEQDG